MTPQAITIARHLEQGNTITALNALGVFGVHRLAARILELKQAGWDIQKHTREDAKGRRYAEYYAGVLGWNEHGRALRDPVERERITLRNVCAFHSPASRDALIQRTLY